MKTIVTDSGPIDATALEAEMAEMAAGDRIRLLGERFRGRVMATSSFGLQAAVMLQLMKQHAPDVPIVFIDTGYLFPETYRYVEELQEFIGFTPVVYAPTMTAARQEALKGRLWEQGREGSDEYARINKIEPMNRALQDLGADVWISGLRRSQSKTRSDRGVVEQQSQTTKIYPILEWDDDQVEAFMMEHGLPRHPLGALGYRTMGDWHSTRPVEDGGDAEGTRFGGEKYECGLHLESGVQDFQI